MTPLRFPFDRDEYRHVLLARAGLWCVVERTWIGDGKPHLPHYEVVRLQCVREKHWPDGRHTPAHEAYPSPAQWGREGWSEPTLRHAATRWERVRAKLKDTLPTWSDLGIPDDEEGYQAWKEGRLRRPAASAQKLGISEGHP